MNTADRSIALIDYAIRRRFDFVELRPDRFVLEQYLKSIGQQTITERVLELFDVITLLMESQPDFAIGHTYFMGKDAQDIAQRVVFQVLPLLAEYQKEGILNENAALPLTGWPGASGLPIKNLRPFDVAEQLAKWFEMQN